MKKPKLSTVLSCLGLFFFIMLFIFPFQNLRGFIFGKIYAATRILIVADDMSPSFFGWPGVSLKNVNITLPVATSEIELSSERVTVRVGLAALFPPSPSVSLNMTHLKSGGDLYLRVSQPGNKANAVIEASGVNLEQIAIPGLSETVPGILNTDTNLSIDLAELSKSTGYLDLTADKLRTPSYMVDVSTLGPPFLIPGMSVGNLTIKMNIKNGTVEFPAFKFGTPDSNLKGAVTADIRLGKTYLLSMINLALRFQLSDKIMQNPQTKTFTSFLQSFQTSTPGSYSMKWSATVKELVDVTIKVLPEKGS